MNRPPLILIVDDEPNVRRILGDILTHSGYQVVTAASVAEALDTLKTQVFDLVLLDLAVGPDDGMEVARAVRERSDYTAIVILTGKGTLQTAIEAIQLNLQGYLLKPASPQQLRDYVAEQLTLMAERRQRDELAEHMRAAVSSMYQAPEADEGTLRSGSLEIQASRRRATFRGRELSLTTVEFDLLNTLVCAEGTVLDPQTLASKALGYSPGDLEARELVKIHISHIRYKLEPDPGNPRHILTVRGKGYLWAPD